MSQIRPFICHHEKSELKKKKNYWRGGSCPAVCSALLPVSCPVAYPELLPSPGSSMSFSNSNLGFFSIFTFLTDTSWSGKAGKNFLCFFQCCLESMYFLNYLFMHGSFGCAGSSLPYSGFL